MNALLTIISLCTAFVISAKEEIRYLIAPNERWNRFQKKKKQKGACLPPCLLISLFTADVQNLHNIAEDHYDTFPSNGANTKKRPYVVLSEFNCQVDGGQAKFGLNGGIHH